MAAVGEYHVYDDKMTGIDGSPVLKREDGSRVIRLSYHQARYLIDQGAIGVRPVEPACLIVLCIGVVVAFLRLAEFGAHGEHRRSAREEQRGEKIALILRASGADGGIVRLALGAIVP